MGFTYAVVECVFATVLPRLVGLPGEPASFLTHAGVIAFYVAGGGVLGVATRAAVSRLLPERASAWEIAGPLAGFLVAHSVNLALQMGLTLRSVYAVAIALALAGGAIAAPGRAIFSPSAAFVLALSVPWTVFSWFRDSSSSARLVAGVSLPVALWLAIAASRARLPLAPRTRLAAGLAAALAIVGSAQILQRQHPLRTAATSRPAAGKPPSVVLISMDTVRADHLSLYGYRHETSPELQRLAAEATLYSRSSSTSDMTLPSHASMFTGLYPLAHGAHFAPPDHSYGAPLSNEFTTLAEILGAAGYRTGGVVANHAYLGRAFKINQGFEYWDDRRPLPWVQSVPPYFLRAAIMRGLWEVLPQELREIVYRGADDIRASTLAYLDEASESGGARPIFLFVNFMDAHWPYIPPSRFRGIFEQHENKIPSRKAYRRLRREVSSLQRTITKEEQTELTARYDEAIAYLDSEIGRFIDQLDERGLFDDALVIVTADHGEAFGERNFVEHAASVHSDQIQVPLLIKYPQQTQGRVDGRLASGVDLLPTILDVIGLPTPAGLHGLSLVRPEVGHSVVSESYPSDVLVGWHPRFNRIERSIQEGHYKLIQSTRGTSQLYDIVKDPSETSDLRRTLPEVTRALEEALARWMSSISGPAHTPPTESELLDPELRSRLEELGYLE